MREKIKSIYIKWLDWRIMSKELQIVNAEEKRLKLITKKTKITSGEKATGAVAAAKLRFLKYRRREYDSVEERVNYTYSKLKYNPVASFFRGFFSFSRKYRFMTGFFGYFSVIVSTVQAGAVFVFSSAFFIVSLPFSILTYLIIALPKKIRIIKICDKLISDGRNISLIIAEGLTEDDIMTTHAKELIQYTANKGICLVVSSKIKGFHSVKSISENVYFCTPRFTANLKKRMGKREFLYLIEI